jgi:Flp pilus assembly protein TadD
MFQSFTGTLWSLVPPDPWSHPNPQRPARSTPDSLGTMPTPRVLSAPTLFLIIAVLSGGALTGCKGNRSDLAIRESGDRAYTEGDYAKAVTDYTEYYNLKPQDALANYNLGRALVRNGQPDLGREKLYLAYSIRPANDDYLVAYADSLVATNRKAELYGVLREKIVGRGTTGDYLRLADYARKVGDADQAEQALITASRLEAGASKDIHMRLSDFYAAEKAETKAVERLRMAYYLDPADPKIIDRARALGEVPGPTFGLRPAEMP